MAKSETFQGWTIEHGKNATGKPRITLTKPGRSSVWIDRRVGTDPAVALERIKVSALEQDVAASPEDDRQLWERRLQDATHERDHARARRVAAAAVDQQFAGVEE